MQPTKAARKSLSGHWFRAICLLMTWIPLTPAPSGAQPDLAGEISSGLQLDSGITHSWGPISWEPMLSATEQTPEADPADAGEQRKRPPFPWRITRPAAPDYMGAAQDTAYFMVYQLAAIGLLYVAPESVSGWSDDDKDNYSFDTWQENVSNPQRDTDDYFINYVLHPYWGAAYYVRGRERGFNEPQSFLFSAGLSFLFEFGFEAMFENPSYQDLWITPVIGSLIGHFWFMPVRDRVVANPGVLTWKDKTVLTLTDPLGTLNAATNRLFGIDTTVSVRPIDTGHTLQIAGSPVAREPTEPVLKPKSTSPAWGLHLKMIW